MRVREAIKSRPSWTYVVLTFDPASWASEWEAYRGGLRLWGALRKRIQRQWDKVESIQTWERHKSGWPHINLLIHCPRFNSACNGEGWKKIRRWWEPHAVACGFGRRTWIEPMKDDAAMAGYLTKLARELVGAGLKDQVPVNSPPHFRRLRASPGLLPPTYKNPDYTGELRQEPIRIVKRALSLDEDLLNAVLLSPGENGDEQ